MKPLAAVAIVALAAGQALDCRASEPAAGGGPVELRYVVLLRPDPNRTPLSLPERQRIQDAHMANIRRMADDGILVAAGPMEDNPATISGIFVFKVSSLDEARRIAALDPTVAERRNTVDVHSWLGPPGIGSSYFGWKKVNPGAPDVMAAHVLCLVTRGPSWADGRGPGGGHGGYVESLRRSGALAAAGSVADDPDLLEIIIFKTPSKEDARKAMDQDPSVKSGTIAIEYHKWWTADRVLPW
jgi:uncharacterized protein YciI